MDVNANGIRFHCRIDGPEGAPWLMFSNSLATNLDMWKPQVEALSGAYRVLRYDQRGHGKSEAMQGAYSFELLAEDAVAIMDALGIARCHFIGLSMGGMTAMGLALDHAERLESVAICNSRAEAPADFQAVFDGRIALAESEGMAPLVAPTVERWFTQELRDTAPAFLDDVRGMVRTTPVAGYVGCCKAIRALNYMPRMSEIDLPTLFIAGAQDAATPPEGMRAMHEVVRGSRYAEIDPAAHLSNLEQPERFTQELKEFLGSRAA